MAEIKLEGSVSGLEEVRKAVSQAPEKFRSAILSMLTKERDSFVGNKNKNGLFRRSVIRKKTSRGERFPEKLAKHFKGWVDTKNNSLDMNLEMGLLYRNTNSSIKKAMTIMTTGGEIKNSKYMPIANKKNPEIIGTPTSKIYYLFKSLIKSNKLVWLKRRNKNYWMNKETGKVMFFASKNVKIKQKFQLENEWEKRVPRLIEKYKTTIDKVVNRINK